MRALALDLGSRRIGVAVSDAAGVLATPLTVLARSSDRRRDHARIAELVAEEEVGVVVVGLPLSLDGHEGAAAQAARGEAAELAESLAVPVVVHDERLTTMTANRLLTEAGLDGKARRKVVDQVAASVLLQAWLDGASSRTDGAGRP